VHVAITVEGDRLIIDFEDRIPARTSMRGRHRQHSRNVIAQLASLVDRRSRRTRASSIASTYGYPRAVA